MYYFPFGMAYFQGPMLVLGGVRVFFWVGGKVRFCIIRQRGAAFHEKI